MVEELFIEKLHSSQVHDVPDEIREEAENALRQAVTAQEKLTSLSRMLMIHFAQKNYLAAFFMLEEFLNDPAMMNQKAYLLLKKGRISEFLYEFDDALIYYCRGLASHIVPRKVYFALWHGVSLCLLYKQDFKEAELCCRRVIELDPNQWEAWKNLGVSLEHQSEIKESLDAYVKAVKLIKGNEVSVLHLRRFIERYSEKISNLSNIRQQMYKEDQIII